MLSRTIAFAVEEQIKKIKEAILVFLVSPAKIFLQKKIVLEN